MFAYFNRFEIQMTLVQAQSASHSGDCLEDVKELLKLPTIKRQLNKISDVDLIAELSEYGAWDNEELQDRESNNERIVWLAAGNIVEENYQNKRS